jgi:hypothetical protein
MVGRRVVVGGNPSVSRFVQGRDVVVGEKKPLRLTFQAREGCWLVGGNPSVSCFE